MMTPLEVANTLASYDVSTAYKLLCYAINIKHCDYETFSMMMSGFNEDVRSQLKNKAKEFFAKADKERNYGKQ